MSSSSSSSSVATPTTYFNAKSIAMHQKKAVSAALGIVQKAGLGVGAGKATRSTSSPAASRIIGLLDAPIASLDSPATSLKLLKQVKSLKGDFPAEARKTKLAVMKTLYHWVEQKERWTPERDSVYLCQYLPPATILGTNFLVVKHLVWETEEELQERVSKFKNPDVTTPTKRKLYASFFGVDEILNAHNQLEGVKEEKLPVVNFKFALPAFWEEALAPLIPHSPFPVDYYNQLCIYIYDVDVKSEPIFSGNNGFETGKISKHFIYGKSLLIYDSLSSLPMGILKEIMPAAVLKPFLLAWGVEEQTATKVSSSSASRKRKQSSTPCTPPNSAADVAAASSVPPHPIKKPRVRKAAAAPLPPAPPPPSAAADMEENEEGEVEEEIEDPDMFSLFDEIQSQVVNDKNFGLL